MLNAMAIFGFASRCLFTEQTASSNMSGDCTVVRDQTLPVGLMLRALQACSCAFVSRTPRYEVQPTAVATVQPDPLLATSVNRLRVDESTVFRLQWLEAALSRTEQVLDNLAAEGARHTITTTTCGPALHQQQNNASMGMPCCEWLQLLVQQSMQIREGVMSAQRMLNSLATADALAAPATVEREVGEASTDWTEGGAEGGANVPLTAGHFSALVCDLADAAVPCFPLPVCCNNSGCTNLTNLSEWQLVCGKACVCAGCEVARYCSRKCQQQHWKLHKHWCNSPSA